MKQAISITYNILSFKYCNKNRDAVSMPILRVRVYLWLPRVHIISMQAFFFLPVPPNFFLSLQFPHF